MRKKLLLFIFMFVFIPYVFAEEVEETIEEAEKCEVSEAYLEWLEMPEEEREKVNVPPYCASNGLADLNLNVKSVPSFNRASNMPYYIDNNNIIKDQDLTGTCWAFASTTSVESYVRKRYNFPAENIIYSPGHLNYYESQSFYDRTNPYGVIRTVNSGGNFEMSSLYYINRYGPVFESDYPTVTNVKYLPKVYSEDVFMVSNKLNVNNIEYIHRSKAGSCTNDEISYIQSLVYWNGSVGANMWMDTPYYDYTHRSYVYRGTGNTKTNHSVSIIGWDDDYDVSNFQSGSHKPVYKGAWIVQNSYGTDFGNNGIFYVSYDDTQICTSMFSIRDADGDKDDNSYINVHNLPLYYADSPAVMQVFNKKNNGMDEIIDKVSFRVTTPTSYKIWYYPGNGSGVPVKKWTLLDKGTVESIGYVTATNLTGKISKKLTKYSIAIQLGSNEHSIVNKKQYGYDDEGYAYSTTATEKFTKGTSYLWKNGKWRDLYSYYNNGNFKPIINVFTENAYVEVPKASVSYAYDDHIDINFTVSAKGTGVVKSIYLLKGNKIYAIDETERTVMKGVDYNWSLRKDGLSDLTNGTYTIEVEMNNRKTAYHTVNINLIPILGVIITNKPNVKLPVGDTLQMTGVVTPSTANYIDPTLTWRGDNSYVATVTSDGLVTGVNPGTVTITAITKNGIEKTYTLTVTKPLKEINVDKEYLYLESGNVDTVKYSLNPVDTTDDTTITYKSSDTNVATVSEDLYDNNSLVVTAVRPGISTITLTSKTGITKTITVYVKGFGITPLNYKLELKNSRVMKANSISEYYEVSNYATWTSSKTKVATINQNGKVSAKKLGTTVISATDEMGRVVRTKVTITKIYAAHFTVNNISDKVYTGKSIKPGVKVKYKGTTLKKGTHYTVSYGTNKYPGKGTIKITARKSKLYQGSKTITFIIKPKATSIAKIASGSKYIKVTFNTMPKVTKYQVQYKIQEDSVWQTINVASTNVAYLKNLFTGYNYQVRVRGYITVDGKNYFGGWSKIKTIKCK